MSVGSGHSVLVVRMPHGGASENQRSIAPPTGMLLQLLSLRRTLRAGLPERDVSSA